MLAKKRALLIAGVVLTAVIFFLIFGTPSYQAMKVKNKNFAGLENRLKKAVSTNAEIDMKEIADFAWDECYVFTPYYPPKEIYEKVGSKWATARTYIGFLLFHDMENQTVQDDQYTMIFKNSNNVILAKTYSLTELPVIFKLDNYKFTSNNSKFIVSDVKQYGDEKIKGLILKK